MYKSPIVFFLNYIKIILQYFFKLQEYYKRNKKIYFYYVYNILEV